jgi:hypothetical protein
VLEQERVRKRERVLAMRRAGLPGRPSTMAA